MQSQSMGMGEGWGASWRRWDGKGRRKEAQRASPEPSLGSLGSQGSPEHQLHTLERPPWLPAHPRMRCEGPSWGGTRPESPGGPRESRHLPPPRPGRLHVPRSQGLLLKPPWMSALVPGSLSLRLLQAPGPEEAAVPSAASL